MPVPVDIENAQSQLADVEARLKNLKAIRKRLEFELIPKGQQAILNAQAEIEALANDRAALVKLQAQGESTEKSEKKLLQCAMQRTLSLDHAKTMLEAVKLELGGTWRQIEQAYKDRENARHELAKAEFEATLPGILPLLEQLRSSFQKFCAFHQINIFWDTSASNWMDEIGLRHKPPQPLENRNES